MSFHIKDDFKAGAPISQVPASWFNAVGRFLNGLVGGFGAKVDKHESGRSTVSLDREVLQQEIDNATQGMRTSKETGTPEDKTDAPEVFDNGGDSWTWTAGGVNGLELDAYYKIGASGSYHLFQRCRLTMSRDGLVVKAEGMPDRIRVRA